MAIRTFPKTVLAATAALLLIAIDASAAVGSYDVAPAAPQPLPAKVSTSVPSSVTATSLEVVPKNSAVVAYVKTDAGAQGNGTLYWSPDQDEWFKTSNVMPIVDGYGALAWMPGKTRYYKLIGDGFESNVWRIEVKSMDGYQITAGVRTGQVHSGESTYVTGYAVRDNKGSAQKVRLEQQVGSGSWSTIGYTTARSSGWWGFSVRPDSTTSYRARIVSSSGSVLATSNSVELERTPGTSTLEERRAALAWKLGDPASKVTNMASSYVAAAKYTGGATASRYQVFDKGMLMEVTLPDGSVRTWWLEGDHLAKYKSLGYFRGNLGLPERDQRCQLLEGGCVTLFSGGAVYTNKSSMSKGTYVAYGRYVQTEIIAAALSQKGYEEPSWRNSKYNDWIDGDNAWCQVFVAWATHAAGHPGEAPVRDYFPSYLSEAKSNSALIRRPKASQIDPGDVLIFDWGTGDPTHTGFAVKVSGSYVYTIEGNTTDGTGDPQRGVYYRKRAISGVWGMFHPAAYKANS